METPCIHYSTDAEPRVGNPPSSAVAQPGEATTDNAATPESARDLAANPTPATVPPEPRTHDLSTTL